MGLRAHSRPDGVGGSFLQDDPLCVGAGILEALCPVRLVADPDEGRHWEHRLLHRADGASIVVHPDEATVVVVPHPRLDRRAVGTLRDGLR